MDKIFNFFAQWDKDKLLHVLVTLLVAFVAACITKPFASDPFVIVAVTWFAGFIAGLYKEIRDDVDGTGSDSADWMADVIGTALATVFVLILVV